ncbi:FbpB family small basic protein [Bacillus sp. Marseille-P3661]|uniref:FbpB family small basic protein n=1 Tax=Bacillus sp. Marseille-P3661 TaxID=1936234 RepID=UPI0011595A01|nr:FbpB family small basic protein [Bacillus sp. Marseille-P3661]
MQKMKLTFKQLVNQNRETIIKDSKLQDKIYEKVESRLAAKVTTNTVEQRA